LIPEIIGRLPVLTWILDRATLRSILTEPKNALIKQYQIFLMDEVEFTITDEALDFIVNKALEYKLELVDYVRYVKPF
jgi:ATP-dependent Clp protease ATP-binding subunit ClpX